MSDDREPEDQQPFESVLQLFVCLRLLFMILQSQDPVLLAHLPSGLCGLMGWW